MVEERRKFVRLNAKVKVKYRVLKKDQAQESFTKDLGGGGIRLYLDEKLAVATPLALEIEIPGEVRPILAEGRVAWSKDLGGEGMRNRFDAGIAFTKIDPMDQGKILKYVYAQIY